MPDSYHISSDRYDLVTITAKEYHDLITAGVENKALADKRFSDWCVERNRCTELEKQVAELEQQVKELRCQKNSLMADLIMATDLPEADADA